MDENAKLSLIAKLDELKSELQIMSDRFDASDDEAERKAIGKEAQELIVRVCLRHMIEETAVKPLLAALGVQQFVRNFGDGQVYATGGTVSADLKLAMCESPEFVVPKR